MENDFLQPPNEPASITAINPFEHVKDSLAARYSSAIAAGALALWGIAGFVLSADAGPLLPPTLIIIGLVTAGLVLSGLVRPAALTLLAFTLAGISVSGGLISPWLPGLLVPPALMLARGRGGEAVEFVGLGLAGMGAVALVEGLGLGTGVRIADTAAVAHTALAGVPVLGVLMALAALRPGAGRESAATPGHPRVAPAPAVQNSGNLRPDAPPSLEPAVRVNDVASPPGLVLRIDAAERVTAVSGTLDGLTPRVGERVRHAAADPEALGLWIAGLAEGAEREMVFELAAPPGLRAEGLTVVGRMVHVRALAPIASGGWTLFLQEPPARPDLVAAIAEAKAERDARTVFFASLGHDLKTPLNAIIGFSDLMRRAWLGPLSDVYKDRANLIHESSQDLLLLVDDMLDLARTDAGRYKIAPEPVDLMASGWGVMRLLADTANRRGVKLRVRRGAVVEAQADPRAVRQIWQNLLSNALKYGGDGGEIIAGTLIRDGMAVLYVEDKGPGMSPEEIARIGTPFAQGALAGPATGSGLGLALVQRFAELHGGRVHIQSAKGEGTRVEVILPMVAQDGGELEDVLPEAERDAAE